MRIPAFVESEEGFTIQELLVAIVVGSLLVGFSFTLYLFVTKIVQRDIRTREHRESALRTVELIASDIEGSASVTASTDSSLELLSLARGKRFYCMRQGMLFRDEAAIGPPKQEKWLLEFRNVSTGRVALALKSFWGKDSIEAHVEVAIPMSSAVMFLARDTTTGASAFSRSIVQ
jgi:type II secretory pathway component PulJ